MTSKRIFFSFILSIIVFAAGAQRFAMQAEPVRWKAAVAKVEGRNAVVNLIANIAKGWHLYDLTLPEGGPKPTVLDFSGSKGVKIAGAVKPSVQPTKVHDELFGMDLTQWDGPVTFAVPVKLEGKGEHVLEIKVTYMTCDGNNCRPPKTETITLSIPAK